MNQQSNQLAGYIEDFKKFFNRTFDYRGRSSRREHWVPVGTLYILLALIYGGVFLYIYNEYSRSFASAFVSFDTALSLAIRNGATDYIVMSIIFAIVHIPIVSSFFRRLKDVGFTEIASGILIALYVLLVVLQLYFLINVAVLLILYFLVFFVGLMVLPANKLETTKNDEFLKFVFRQNAQAAAYYAQFNQGQGYPNQNFEQPNQGFNSNNYQGHPNQGFNPNGNQGYNPNQGFDQNNYQGQPNQGFNPNGNQGYNPNQGFDQNNYQGQPNQNFNPNNYQGQPNQGFNPNGNQGYNPNQGFDQNNYQGQPNQNFNPNNNQGQPNQGFNPNGNQGYNPNFNPNGNQGFNPNPGVNQKPQNFNPNKEEPRPVAKKNFDRKNNRLKKLNK